MAKNDLTDKSIYTEPKKKEGLPKIIINEIPKKKKTEDLGNVNKKD